MGDGKPAGKRFDAVSYANFVVEGIATKLQRAGRDECEIKARWLINHVTGVPFGDITTKGIQPMIREQWDALGKFLERVIAGEPIQYVVGNADFMGRIFQCDKRALIPRPETEELVEAVLAVANRATAQRIIDVGTGTGCIALTLALELPNAEVIATDISADALALARENATAHGQESRVTFRQADLLDGLESQSADIIVSNPPYIAEVEAASLAPEIREHEPHSALFAGADGLTVIRRLVDQSRAVLRPGGWLFMEIGENQGVSVPKILEAVGFTEIEVRKDLAGHDRIAQGRRR
jgi:release factor glutamine methyltransferase